MQTPQLATLPHTNCCREGPWADVARCCLTPRAGLRLGLSSAAAAERSLQEPFQCAEEGTGHSQVGDAGGLHISQGCSVGAEGRGAVDQGAVLSQALQDTKPTNPLVIPLLQTQLLCQLPPESHTEQELMPSCKHLQLIYSA